MTPWISVVMAVHNGEADLVPTMESVLNQAGADLEFIVVDDGSTDLTPNIIESFAIHDTRVRPLHLTKVGLTRSLIAGCASARGALIARQDCGDRSLPDRLSRQAALMMSERNAVLCSVGTRFVGPNGEHLYDVTQTSNDVWINFAAEGAKIRGPSHHGATMFLRNAYESVGGYRAAFDVAQDIDLWLRLMERGEFVSTPEIFYEAAVSIGAISHVRRTEQMRAGEIILASAAARKSGEGDARLLSDWSVEQKCYQSRRCLKQDIGGFNYFVGSALRLRDIDKAAEYFRGAFRHAPLRPKIWVRLLQIEARRAVKNLFYVQ